MFSALNAIIISYCCYSYGAKEMRKNEWIHRTSDKVDFYNWNHLKIIKVKCIIFLTRNHMHRVHYFPCFLNFLTDGYILKLEYKNKFENWIQEEIWKWAKIPF